MPEVFLKRNTACVGSIVDMSFDLFFADLIQLIHKFTE